MRSFQLPLYRFQRQIEWNIAYGLLITLGIALAARWLSELPWLGVIGQLVLAMVIGMICRTVYGVKPQWQIGITFSTKRLLRFGIILLGMRLNLSDMVQLGPSLLVIAAVNVICTLVIVYTLSRWFKVAEPLSILTACGTAICGAAAVAAIAPQLKAKEEDIALSAAIVALLGTVFTVMYTLLYPLLGLAPGSYGIFAGATLHEVAHVVAAAAPGGQDAVDLAVLVKLTRVSMLVPVAILVGLWSQRKQNISLTKKERLRSIPVPWFIGGFLLMSAIHTAGWIPEAIANILVWIAYLLIAMAMAGLGMSVRLAHFRCHGARPLYASLIGSVILAVLGYILVVALGMAA